MKKSELKTGYIVEYRSGILRKVILGAPEGDALIDKDGFLGSTLESIANDLRHRLFRRHDIVAVYRPLSLKAINKWVDTDPSFFYKIFERPREKFYLVAKIPSLTDKDSMFFNLYTGSKRRTFMGSMVDCGDYQTLFTQEEIDNMDIGVLTPMTEEEVASYLSEKKEV